jgi:hypothetical protein
MTTQMDPNVDKILDYALGFYLEAVPPAEVAERLGYAGSDRWQLFKLEVIEYLKKETPNSKIDSNAVVAASYTLLRRTGILLGEDE